MADYEGRSKKLNDNYIPMTYNQKLPEEVKFCNQ